MDSTPQFGRTAVTWMWGLIVASGFSQRVIDTFTWNEFLRKHKNNILCSILSLLSKVQLGRELIAQKVCPEIDITIGWKRIITYWTKLRIINYKKHLMIFLMQIARSYGANIVTRINRKTSCHISIKIKTNFWNSVIVFPPSPSLLYFSSLGKFLKCREYLDIANC